MTLSKTEIMVILTSIQLALVKHHECACDHNSGFCFVHDAEKLLRRIARETGMPLQVKNIVKPKADITTVAPEFTLTPSAN